MAAKHMQNAHEKAQLEWVKNNKLFHKRDAKYQKVTKIKTK